MTTCYDTLKAVTQQKESIYMEATSHMQSN